MLLLFIVGISAYAFGPGPESTCSVVEYDQTISGEAQFRSTEFTCVKGNGDFLSYGFDNTAGADCMVELYKKGLIWDTKVSSYCDLGAGFIFILEQKKIGRILLWLVPFYIAVTKCTILTKNIVLE